MAAEKLYAKIRAKSRPGCRISLAIGVALATIAAKLGIPPSPILRLAVRAAYRIEVD